MSNKKTCQFISTTDVLEKCGTNNVENFKQKN